MAWLALVTHYECATEKNRIKEAAYSTIQNATGEHQNWSFEQYYYAYQEAHYDHKMYGEILTETKKVTDFLHGITDS